MGNTETRATKQKTSIDKLLACQLNEKYHEDKRL